MAQMEGKELYSSRRCHLGEERERGVSQSEEEERGNQIGQNCPTRRRKKKLRERKWESWVNGERREEWLAHQRGGKKGKERREDTGEQPGSPITCFRPGATHTQFRCFSPIFLANCFKKPLGNSPITFRLHVSPQKSWNLVVVWWKTHYGCRELLVWNPPIFETISSNHYHP